MKKRIAVCMIAASLAASTLTGCTGNSLSGDEIVAEFGNTQIPVGVAEFYARYEQAQYETYYMSYYGDDMWTMDMGDGTTYEDSVKSSVLEAVEMMYILESHMDEYNVTFTEEDEAAVEAAAKEFIEANGEEELAAVSADEDNIKEVLKLFTIQQRMYTAMIADADTEVSDEEAAQKSMDYVFFPFETTDTEGNTTTLTDEEKVALKETADAFQLAATSGEKTFAECAEEAGVEASTLTFDSESTTPDSALIEEVDALGEGQVTNIVETENGYYVAQVTSLLDREATDAEKESIVAERQQTLYTDLCTEWKEAADIKEYDNVWKKVDFEKLGVSIKDTTEESTEDTTEDTTETTDTESEE